MATPWPITLPQAPELQNLQISFGENQVEFAPDGGRAIRRPRYTMVDDRERWAFHFTAAQYAIFETFYKVMLRDGNLPFQHTDPFSSTVRDFTFESQPALSMIHSDLFSISFDVDRRPA